MNPPMVMQVRDAIAEYIGKPVEVVLVTSSFEGLGLDSLDLVKLSLDMEDRFHVLVPSAVLDEWKKVSDVVLWLDRTLKNCETDSADIETAENI